MSQEWSKNNEFNSFNSWKGLLYAPWYQGVADKRFLPPVEASLDPIHACNLMCQHCNAHRYLTHPPKRKMIRMPDEHLRDLVTFLGNWGVKAICFGGGGEPTLHTRLADAIELAFHLHMGTSIATNGTRFDDHLIETMADCCRWVGISVDAATPKTYRVGRKQDLFSTAINNMVRLINRVEDTKSSCDVAYKFLIFNYNQHEIFKACKLAKSLGVRDFHARPADWSHQGMGEIKQKIGNYDTKIVLDQFEKCHAIEDENFRVFTVVHKFDEHFKPLKNFSACYAAPLCIQLCADGQTYLCPDTRHMPYYKLGSHYPDPANILTFWGKHRHQSLVFKTGYKRCTTRCTFAPYCKQCEELFIKGGDPMCWKFI